MFRLASSRCWRLDALCSILVTKSSSTTTHSTTSVSLQPPTPTAAVSPPVCEWNPSKIRLHTNNIVITWSAFLKFFLGKNVLKGMQNEIILRLCALVCVKGDIALKKGTPHHVFDKFGNSITLCFWTCANSQLVIRHYIQVQANAYFEKKNWSTFKFSTLFF